MRLFFIFLSLSFNLLASSPNCTKKMSELSSGPENLFDHISLEQKISHAAETLDLAPAEFLARLDKYNTSVDKFFADVERFRSSERVRFLDFMYNPFKVASVLKEAIKGRQITNTNFLESFLGLAALNTGTMIHLHINEFGLERFDILSSQLFALLLTEVFLTLSSAKHAAYLVAHPELISSSKKFVQNLDDKEVETVGKLKYYFLKAIGNLKDITNNSAKKVAPMASLSFVSGIVPFTFISSLTYTSTEAIIVNTLVSLGFHTAFISLWANFRYELLFEKVYPMLSRKFTESNKMAERFLIGLFMVGNSYLASETYTSWSYYLDQAVKDEYDDNDE